MELKDKEILNEAELMELLGVSRTTLWKLRRDRNLPYGKVGREYRYLKSEIIRWLKESKYQMAPQQRRFDFLKGK
ncbi:MAG: helix-turn-helix domain-containing protein [Deltaproteobacteria bacterium]|nr:helix-turn-helix domain-containing protein [Deltaproteobacteria bacterium]MBW2121402.1 helix-turn-helix domain-containing protein [Deltaproteobacteria bacterium]